MMVFLIVEWEHSIKLLSERACMDWHWMRMASPVTHEEEKFSFLLPYWLILLLLLIKLVFVS